MKRLMAILLVLMLTCVALTGCNTSEPGETQEVTSTPSSSGGVESTEELPVLRVAVMPYLLSLPVVYMVDNGWDVENGFKVETSVYTVGAPMNEALAAGLWDVGTIGAAGVFSVAGYDAIGIGDILLSSGGTACFVRPDHPIASVKGALEGYPDVYGDAETIKGATILVPTGSVNHLNVVKWIELFGLTQDDVNLVSMDYASAFQAFKAGEGDVVCIVAPLSYSGRDEGWVDAGGLEKIRVDVYDSLIANSNSVKDEATKDTIVKFVKQFYRVCDLFAADPELAAELELQWQEDNGLTSTIDNARLEVASRPFVTSEMAMGMETCRSLKEQAEFFARIGNLEEAQLSKFNEETLTKEFIDAALGVK